MKEAPGLFKTGLCWSSVECAVLVEGINAESMDEAAKRMSTSPCFPVVNETTAKPRAFAQGTRGG